MCFKFKIYFAVEMRISCDYRAKPNTMFRNFGSIRPGNFILRVEGTRASVITVLLDNYSETATPRFNLEQSGSKHIANSCLIGVIFFSLRLFVPTEFTVSLSDVSSPKLLDPLATKRAKKVEKKKKKNRRIGANRGEIDTQIRRGNSSSPLFSLTNKIPVIEG